MAYTSSGACVVVPLPMNRDSTADWTIVLFGVSSSMIDIRTKADYPSVGTYHVYVTLYYVKTT